MELALTITAGLGILLFLIGYLAFILAGFRQNFITGIISALPVLNIVTVPALWHKTSKKLMISVLGVAIVTASWFFGADANIKKILFSSNNMSNETTQTAKQTLRKTPSQVVGTTVIRPLNEKVSVRPFANKQRIIDESEMQQLPTRALYKFSFETVPVGKVNTLKGRVVQLITKNNKSIEGRINRVSNSSIFLQSGSTISVENEYPIANIKQLRLMVKKAVSE